MLTLTVIHLKVTFYKINFNSYNKFKKLRNQGRSVSSKIENALKDFREQMPKGFEEFGIGPLAPAILSEKAVDVQYPAFGVRGEVHDVYLTGLNEFEIVKSKVNVITSKITVSLKWPGELRAKVAHYTLKSFAKTHGFDLILEGDGAVDFFLQGLKAELDIKYSFNIFSHKVQIKKLKVKISLEKCLSDISGIKANQLNDSDLNKLICEYVFKGINDNQEKFNDAIEEHGLPAINNILRQK